MIFQEFLWALRQEGLAVGVGEWLVFLESVSTGLIADLDSLYLVGRSVLCRSETEYDSFDVAYGRVFRGASGSSALKDELKKWLEQAMEQRSPPPHEREYKDLKELWEAFQETLRKQTKAHHGGNRWIGTGGTSPWGHSGQADGGIRIGGDAQQGGGRASIRLAGERKWANYRADRTLDVRDTKLALRALRNLQRQGEWHLDLDQTIEKTCNNGGEIELVEARERQNQVHLVLLMDAGGSMAPHYERVSQLFSAAKESGHFKSFTHYSFHNCVYQWLYKDIEQLDRVPTAKILDELTPKHRLIFVGDASMAPYELFSPFGWPNADSDCGLDWLRRFRQRCQASVWVNPDPTRYWNHPTVSAIGNVFPMYELTLDGLRRAVKTLRAPI